MLVLVAHAPGHKFVGAFIAFRLGPTNPFETQLDWSGYVRETQDVP